MKNKQIQGDIPIKLLICHLYFIFFMLHVQKKASALFFAEAFIFGLLCFWSNQFIALSVDINNLNLFIIF